MNTRIKFKRGNSTQKLSSEEVMNAGEPLLELDTNILYTATEDDTLAKNVNPINVSEDASLGNHGKVHEIFTIAPAKYGKYVVARAEQTCNCIWEKETTCSLALCTDNLTNVLWIKPFEKVGDFTNTTTYEVIPKLIQLTSSTFKLQINSGADELWDPVSIPSPLTSGCYRIYWKASLGTGKATWGVSETYINCESSDPIDVGFIAAEYNGSKLSVQPYGPNPETHECDGLRFSATAATGANTVYFNVFKIYKVIE